MHNQHYQLLGYCMGTEKPTVFLSWVSRVWVWYLILAHCITPCTCTAVSRFFTGILYNTGEPCIFILFFHRQSLGFFEFFVVAHDRGARVAHRLAVEYPTAVKNMMLLDICPTLMMYESSDMAFVRSTLSSLLHFQLEHA